MDIVGLGLANIDLVAHVEESFLGRHNLRKGAAMRLSDVDFGRLRAELPAYDAIPGGCAANTICGLAASGIKTGFFGKIGSDSFESLYRSAFRDYAVSYGVEADAQESSQCAVLVTKDGERTFAYTDGASWSLSPADIDRKALELASLIYAEIYLFEFGSNSDTARLVFDVAAAHKIPLAIKVMNDAAFSFKYAGKLRALADAGILTFLIGNEDNLPALLGTKLREDTLSLLTDWPCTVLMTVGKEGAFHIKKGIISHYTVDVIENPKNTTGAGDQFAAGFFTGWLDKQPVEDCMRHGASCARVILGHDTPRPPLVTRHSIHF